MKHLLPILFIICISFVTHAKEFADEYDCKSKIPSACIRMALRGLGGRESKKIMRELLETRPEKQNESPVNRKAYLIAGALQFGNTTERAFAFSG